MASAADTKNDIDPKKVSLLSGADLESKYASFSNLLNRAGGFCPPPHDPKEGGKTMEDLVSSTNILVVGAGGLGCELLKCLALTGFCNITVIDMDTIDVSNLNRQFLFRETDVDKYKARAAAQFVMRRCKNVRVHYETKALQEFPPGWYKQFHIVISGLDSVSARSDLCKILCGLVKYDESGEIDFETVIPMIDGGSGGWNGQARLFIPRYSSCFVCQTGTLSGGPKVEMCTVAMIPRVPEHCAMYALDLWNTKLISFKSVDDYKLADEKDTDVKSRDPVKLDKDNAAHMSWLFHRASEHAEKFKIKGVTYALTQQVVKGITPIIGATNAFIAAACVTEAFKWRTLCSFRLNNWFSVRGDAAHYSDTMVMQRKADCLACQKPLLFTVDPATTTGAALAELVKKEGGFDCPNIVFANGMPIYNSNPILSDPNGKKLLKDIGVAHQTPLKALDKTKGGSAGAVEGKEAGRERDVVVRYIGEFPKPQDEN